MKVYLKNIARIQQHVSISLFRVQPAQSYALLSRI